MTTTELEVVDAPLASVPEQSPKSHLWPWTDGRTQLFRTAFLVAIGLLAWVVLIAKGGNDPLVAMWGAAALSFPALAWVDFHFHRLPTAVLAFIAACTVPFLIECLFVGSLTISDVGAALAVGLGVYVAGNIVWYLSPGLGYGDVRLATLLATMLALHGVSSALLGVLVLPPFIALAVVLPLALRFQGRIITNTALPGVLEGSKRTVLPYGPALLGGAYIVMLFGATITSFLTHLGAPGGAN